MSAPVAATITSAVNPSTRSTRITVVASVFDPAAGAVSAIRTTSPPMLLGRKLLKNMLTQIDSVSRRAMTLRILDSLTASCGTPGTAWLAGGIGCAGLAGAAAAAGLAGSTEPAAGCGAAAVGAPACSISALTILPPGPLP